MATEREITQFEKVRVASARRPMHLLGAQLEQWIRKVSPGFVEEAWKLVGTLRDAIRVGQYDLGIPFTYQRSAELLPLSSQPLVLNVKKFGVISHMVPFVSNITANTPDARLNAGVTRIQIGAQTIYEAQDGTLFRPSEVFATGFVPVAGGFGLPADEQGYLRRIPVAQGDVIEVEIRNFSQTDTFQVGLLVTQYGMIPPQALEDD